MDRGYQYGFSELHRDSMYNTEKRQRKAGTMLNVLCDYYGGDRIQDLDVLDIGASTGIIDEILSRHFKHVTGIDIDKEAISYAQDTYKKTNLSFISGDALNIGFPDNTFDIVICAQIYEHVPDASVMMGEIFRVLRQGGVCYFSAGNRMAVKEPHYNLPFLSVLPKGMAHLYMRLSGKGSHYYETHLSYWGLLKLVNEFELVDYTKRLICEPEEFGTEYMIKPGSSRQSIATLIADNIYWLMPGYVWLLKKPLA